MRQVVYTMFISNNCISSRLWSKESLVKHQKASKIYAIDCLQNFLSLFMSLLTVKFGKSSYFKARIYLIFLKNVLKQNWNSFNTKFWPQWKDRKYSYRVRQILTLFCNLTSLILGESSVKGIRVTGIAKKIKFQGAWCELKPKKVYQRQPVTRHFGLILVFMWGGARREKFNFCFSRVFC